MPPTDPLPILTETNFTARAEAAKHVHVDVSSLASALRSRIDGDVRFDRSSRALYATDGSSYRQVPIGVVLPRHTDDVVATIATCRDFGAPVLSRGGARRSPVSVATRLSCWTSLSTWRTSSKSIPDAGSRASSPA